MTKQDLLSRVADMRDKRQLSELVTVTKMSKSYISKWLSGKLSGDTSKFELALRNYFGGKKLSFADKQRTSRIRVILSEADQPIAILSELARTTER